MSSSLVRLLIHFPQDSMGGCTHSARCLPWEGFLSLPLPRPQQWQHADGASWLAVTIPILSR